MMQPVIMAPTENKKQGFSKNDANVQRVLSKVQRPQLEIEAKVEEAQITTNKLNACLNVPPRACAEGFFLFLFHYCRVIVRSG